MGGIWARIDRLRGVWKAPAGTEASVVDVTGLASTINDQENGVLNPLGLNCLRTFPGQGAVVWGARTMDRFADEFKYIPVRRLALYLEGSIYSGTHWAVFEPNNDQLWTQIRVAVSAFMNSLFVQGAFVGQTPNDAYFVKCDHETTTQVDLVQGIVNIVIGFAPTYPAEFVVITIQQNAAAPSNPPK
jgi:phage tail sheath protein FI